MTLHLHDTAARTLREFSPRFKMWAWRILAIWAVVLVVTNLLLGTYWQNGVREAVDFEDEGYIWALVVGVVRGWCGSVAGRGCASTDRHPCPRSRGRGSKSLHPLRRASGSRA